MPGIQTGIQLTDNFTSVMYGVINSVNSALVAMDNMAASISQPVDTSAIQDARSEIDQVTAALNRMNETIANSSPAGQTPTSTQTSSPTPTPQAQPVSVPVHWQTDGLEVFTNTGIDRFRQEAQSANQMLSQLSSTQSEIARNSTTANILPPNAAADMTRLSTRIDAVQQNIERISRNPLNVGTSEANNGLEHMRSLLNQAIQEQTRLNTAMASGDVSAANESYNRLLQTISQTERYIRDNTTEQGRFNQTVQETTSSANALTSAIRSAVSFYALMKGMRESVDLSDSITQTTARLDLMNDGVQSTQELFNMVYAAAQDSRSSLNSVAQLVTRIGLNAKDAFGSSNEIVAFADLIQKQMTIGGASTQEAAAATLQLSQALASGVLRGEELNSVASTAPGIIQNIADYLDVPKGKIKDMAAEGEITADIVKNAIFAAADETNAMFAKMPWTFSQIWTTFKDSAKIAFRPVMERLSEIANSTAFQTFVYNATECMATLANMVLNVFDLIGNLGQFISDNWSVISPIVYGVIGALGVYIAYMAIVKAVELASAAASAIHAVAMSAKIGITAALTGSTMAATAAQMGYNGALYACPIVWIIALIIALIAVIFAVANATAKYTGITASGFGLICGCVNVVIQWFKNLGLSVANIFLGIGNAIAALGSNMMTAFHNAISSVQSWFYDLLSAACEVIEGICAALNKLPFVSFDYSGISSAASDYAEKAAEAAENKEDYTSITDAFNEGYGTFDAFQDDWIVDAFDAGANWGDGIAEKIDNFELSDIFGQTEMPNTDDYTGQFDEAMNSGGNTGYVPSVGDIGGSAGSGIGDTAANTADIKDSLDITNEQLKYLRDAAEQEVINRFTTAEIKVEMTNNNTVNSDIDIDGMVSKLADGVNEAMIYAAEGVH